MKKHIKEAWLARLTPEWWETRAQYTFRNSVGMCANGVLCDTIDPSRWIGNFYVFPNGERKSGIIPEVVGRAIGYDYWAMQRVSVLSDSGRYEALIAAVRAIPES